MLNRNFRRSCRTPMLTAGFKTIRELFVGILDYDNADQLVSLENPQGTPSYPRTLIWPPAGMG